MLIACRLTGAISATPGCEISASPCESTAAVPRPSDRMSGAAETPSALPTSVRPRSRHVLTRLSLSDNGVHRSSQSTDTRFDLSHNGSVCYAEGTIVDLNIHGSVSYTHLTLPTILLV